MSPEGVLRSLVFPNLDAVALLRLSEMVNPCAIRLLLITRDRTTLPTRWVQVLTRLSTSMSLEWTTHLGPCRTVSWPDTMSLCRCLQPMACWPTILISTEMCCRHGWCLPHPTAH